MFMELDIKKDCVVQNEKGGQRAGNIQQLCGEK